MSTDVKKLPWLLVSAFFPSSRPSCKHFLGVIHIRKCFIKKKNLKKTNKPLKSGSMKAIARKEGLESLKFFTQPKCKGAGLRFFSQWQQTLPAVLRSPCRRYLGMKNYTHSHVHPKRVSLTNLPPDELSLKRCAAMEVLRGISLQINRQVCSPCCLGRDCPKKSEILFRSNILNSAISCLLSTTSIT